MLLRRQGQVAAAEVPVELCQDGVLRMSNEKNDFSIPRHCFLIAPVCFHENCGPICDPLRRKSVLEKFCVIVLTSG